MKQWIILDKFNSNNSKNINEEILNILFKNRGLKDKKAIREFCDPKLENITTESVGIDKKQLKKVLVRIYKAIDKKEQIIVYGDYDVDGITGTAILWETLNSMGAKVLPYLPNRIEEGYGLSIAGISNIKNQRSKINEVKLIITVDNGIVANEAVEFARENGIDVIITDHHLQDKKLPDAFAIVHTTKLCGAGIAWVVAKELKKAGGSISNGIAASSRKNRTPRNDSLDDDNHLELAALGTIADMVPLTGANRAIVKFGLEKLSRTRRPGLIELFKQSGIQSDVYMGKLTLGIYEVGFIIAPRLNAAGRIENAIDGLRLLCTKDKNKARELAQKLELINRERQLIMKQAKEHASLSVKMQHSLKKILIVGHESYQQGIIGLVAGKLVDEFYRPSIVLSIGEKYSKASARSISGFNIIEFLRSKSEYLVNVGGHPMAAGFTIETNKIIAFKESVETIAENLLVAEALTRNLRIDCELPFSVINKEFYNNLAQLAPFGMGNPEPVFVTKNVVVDNIKVLGKEGKHLKLHLKSPHFAKASRGKQILNLEFEGIAFGMGEMAREIKIGDAIDIAYTVDENTWNGNSKLQLKVKDLRKTK